MSDSARRAVRFQATALWVVTALSVLAAAVVIAQVVSRTLRVSDEERESMAALGWRRRDLGVERALEGGIAAIAAAPIAGLVASPSPRCSRSACCGRSNRIPARTWTGS